jgi:catechol-2,3-dioxygenase
MGTKGAKSVETPPLMRVSHVAVEVADLSRMAEFYSDLWGLAPTEEDRGSLFLRAESPDHHVVSLYEGTSGRLHHVAFEASSRDQLSRAADAIVEHGGSILYGPGPSPDEPGVQELVRFGDPDDNVIEIIYGMEQVPDKYANRYVKPQDLNHAVINVSDVDRAERFYTDVLGFRVSDWIKHFMTFMRCNPNHHSLAVKVGDPGLDHAAFTTTGWEELSRGVFYLGEHGVPRVWGPGRHGPGNNLFSYFRDPEGNIVEYTAEVIQVDDESWQARLWTPDQGNLWPGGASSTQSRAAEA